MYKPNNFELYELVSKEVYDKYGQRAWGFLDKNALEVIQWIREGIGKSMTINNWKYGGSFSQRGFRENTCEMVKKYTLKGRTYCSTHMFGKGFDFNVKGMTANEVREWIIDNKEDCPHPIYLEDSKSAPTWVHIDTRMFDYEKKGRVYLFGA